MQVGLGRRFVVEKQLSTKGSTPDVEFKVCLPDPYTLSFMYDCGVMAGLLLKVGGFRQLALPAL